jgi:sugar lactone lactonase YvrE
MHTLRLASCFLVAAVVSVAQQYVITTVAGNSPQATSGLANMAGNWQFSAQSSVFGLSFSVAGQVAQIGNNVSGQLAVSGTPCATSAALSGTLSNAGVVAMRLNENGQAVAFSGSLLGDGNSAGGAYAAPSGGCTNGDKGQWSGQRVSAPSGSAANGGLATNATLDAPYGVAADSTGALYIAEVGSNETDARIWKVSPSGIITTVAGNGTNGYAGDGGPAVNALLDAPFGVWADGLGDLYIADTGNERVREVSPSGIVTTLAGIGGALPGQAYPTSGVPATTALLYSPSALTTDSLGNLYIAQGGLDIVSKVSSSGIITTVAGNAIRGYSGDGGSALKAELYAPSGVAVDSSGNVFIADNGNARVRKVSPVGIITTVAGNGTQGYAGDGGPATSAQLQYPSGIAIDSVGNLYVADLGNNRVRKIAPNGIIGTIAGNGVQGYSGDGGLGTNAELSRPNSLSVDNSGNVFVADTSNNVVRLLQPAGSHQAISSATNGASNLSSASISAGEIIVLYGSGLGPAQLAAATLGGDGLYDSQLAGTSVTINGTPAPMVYAWATQTSAIVPYEVAGATAQITVLYEGQTTAAFSVPIASSAPEVFSFDSTGRGQAAAINQDGTTINDAANPANVGDIISLYATGEGQTTPPRRRR